MKILRACLMVLGITAVLSLNAASSSAAMSAGCTANTGAPTGIRNFSINVNGTKRTYVLSVPATYDNFHPLALIFGWHAKGMSGEYLRANFRDRRGTIESYANNQAIFVYPDGLSGEWDLTQNGRDVVFFDVLLRHLESTYCINTENIFSFGFSFGAYFSHTLACYRPNILGGIAVFSGGAPTDCRSPVAVFIGHAIGDPIVSLKIGEAARDQWLNLNQCERTTLPDNPSDGLNTSCVAYQGCLSGYPVVWCPFASRFHERNSQWGAAAVWNFFKKQMK